MAEGQQEIFDCFFLKGIECELRGKYRKDVQWIFAKDETRDPEVFGPITAISFAHGCCQKAQELKLMIVLLG